MSIWHVPCVCMYIMIWDSRMVVRHFYNLPNAWWARKLAKTLNINVILLSGLLIVHKVQILNVLVLKCQYSIGILDIMKSKMQGLPRWILFYWEFKLWFWHKRDSNNHAHIPGKSTNYSYKLFIVLVLWLISEWNVILWCAIKTTIATMHAT